MARYELPRQPLAAITVAFITPFDGRLMASRSGRAPLHLDPELEPEEPPQQGQEGHQGDSQPPYDLRLVAAKLADNVDGKPERVHDLPDHL